MSCRSHVESINGALCCGGQQALGGLKLVVAAMGVSLQHPDRVVSRYADVRCVRRKASKARGFLR